MALYGLARFLKARQASSKNFVLTLMHNLFSSGAFVPVDFSIFRNHLPLNGKNTTIHNLNKLIFNTLNAGIV
jgi:hypothetical protein